jgi:hypothetical protein
VLILPRKLNSKTCGAFTFYGLVKFKRKEVRKMNRIFKQVGGVYRAKAYIEYEVDAANETEAIERLRECIMQDLEDGSDLKDIADTKTERISDGSLELKW